MPTDKKAEMTALTEAVDTFAEELNERHADLVDKWSDHYSERNALLIVMQRPSATVIHGYREWLSNGRQVKKGQRGIRILAPAGQARGEVTQEHPDGKPGRQFFRLISVFDIGQTEEIITE